MEFTVIESVYDPAQVADVYRELRSAACDPNSFAHQCASAVEACEWLLRQGLLPREFKLGVGEMYDGLRSIITQPPPFDPHELQAMVAVNRKLELVYAAGSYSPF
jgi:hypothetical protein